MGLFRFLGSLFGIVGRDVRSAERDLIRIERDIGGLAPIHPYRGRPPPVHPLRIKQKNQPIFHPPTGIGDDTRPAWMTPGLPDRGVDLRKKSGDDWGSKWSDFQKSLQYAAGIRSRYG